MQEKRFPLFSVSLGQRDERGDRHDCKQLGSAHCSPPLVAQRNAAVRPGSAWAGLFNAEEIGSLQQVCELRNSRRCGPKRIVEPLPRRRILAPDEENTGTEIVITVPKNAARGKENAVRSPRVLSMGLTNASTCAAIQTLPEPSASGECSLALYTIRVTAT
jgi:hypothetical protein